MGKRIRNVLKYLFTSLSVLLVTLILLSQLKPVQNAIAQKAIRWFGQKTGAEVTLNEFRWRKMKIIEVKDLLLKDTEGDTLVAIDHGLIKLNPFALFQRKVQIHEMLLSHSTVYLHINETGTLNYQFLIDAFPSGDSPSASRPWTITPDSVSVDHFSFEYFDENTKANLTTGFDSLTTSFQKLDLQKQQLAIEHVSLVNPTLDYLIFPSNDNMAVPPDTATQISSPDLGWNLSVKSLHIQNGTINYQEKSGIKQDPGFNPQHIALENVRVDVNNITIDPTGMQAHLQKLTLRDHSGLAVNHLSSRVHFTDNFTELDQFEIQTGNSRVNQYLKLTYPDFGSLVRIASKNGEPASPIQVQWAVKESHIGPQDIRLFIPDILPSTTPSPITLDMEIEGSLAKLFIRQLDIAQGAELNFNGTGELNHLLKKDQFHFDLAINNSTADYKKLNSFLPKGTIPPALDQWGSMQLTGSVKGKQSDFRIQNLSLKTETGPQLTGNSRIKGLPNVKTANFQVQLDNLITHPNHWKGFVSDSLPGFIDSLGIIALKVTYTGSLTDFTTNLSLHSGMGSLFANTAINFNSDYSDAAYQGAISLQQFDLGKITGDSLLSTVTLIADIEGKGLQPQDWDTQITAVVKDLTYKHYSYDSLYLNGQLKASVFDGLVQLKDPNFAFNYDGLISFEDTIPAYHFALQVDTVNLEKLGLYEAPLGLSTKLSVNCSNATLDQLEGDLIIDYLSITDADNHYHSDTIRISSHMDSTLRRELTGQSKLASFGISGLYELSQLPDVWISWLDQYFLNSKLLFPSSPAENTPVTDSLTTSPTKIDAYIHLNDPTELTGIFLPGLKKLHSADLTLQFDNTRDVWNIQGEIPDLEYGDFKANDIRITSLAQANGIQTTIMADSLQNGVNRLLLQPQLSMALKHDSLLFDLTTSVPDSVHSQLGGNITQDSGTLTLRINESLLIGGETWAVDGNNQFSFTPDKQWSINDLNLNKAKEHIMIDGRGNLADSSSHANIAFDKFDLNDLGVLMGYPDGFLGGVLNGQTTLSDIQTNLHYRADLNLQEWSLDNAQMGNLNLKATQLINQPVIKMEANLGGAGSTVRAFGWYDIDQRAFDATAEVDKLEMQVIDPFVKGLIHDSEGYLNGQLNLRGSPDKPILNGSLALNKLKTVIDYVNTTYKIESGTILFTEEEIAFGTIQMADITNQLELPSGKVNLPLATLSGKVNHQFFDQIDMDLQFTTDRFQFLNTTAKDNELFYGSLLLKTDISVTGPIAQPQFKINAQTEPGTRVFVVPLTEEQVITKEDFIVFGKPELDSLGRDTNFVKNYKLTSPGIDLQLNLELTPDAELQVIIDPVTGDKLVCSGSSALTVEMDQAGNVSLNGDYNISSGKYTFNYEQLLKREFDISKGSNIVFNGDPLKAKLDITAVYETRVNLTDLVPDYTAAINQRADVQLQMNIKGDLINPVLTFDILLPEHAQGSLADAANTRLEQIRNNETELNTQVFGLLLFNSFLSSSNNSGSISNAGETVLLSSVSKLITSQLNNFANKLIKGVDFTLGVDAYKPTEEGTLNAGVTTEVQLGLSKRIFNDRLAIKVGGNLNVGASAEEEEVLTAFTSDFALEYSLTPSGNYILRVYRQSDYDAVNEGNVTRTGAGISIKKEFKNKQRKRKK